MVVNDVQSAVNYIKSIVSTAMTPMANKMVDIMQSEVNEQIYADHEPSLYERTGQMGEIAQIHSVDTDSAVVEFKDDGDWTSVLTGEHFFPIIGWEMGKVWKFRSDSAVIYYPPTTIITDSQVNIAVKIPQELKSYLIGQGLDVI